MTGKREIKASVYPDISIYSHISNLSLGTQLPTVKEGMTARQSIWSHVEEFKYQGDMFHFKSSNINRNN